MASHLQLYMLTVSLTNIKTSMTHLLMLFSGAVDMDIYGAFQLCSLGILAAPATVKNSKTYFLDPGRNIIFLWTGLILSGGNHNPSRVTSPAC